MSLILDALNRAEQERKNQDNIPDFTSVHAISVNDSFGSKKKSFIFILLAVVVIAVLVIVVFLGIKLSDKQAPLSQQIAPVQTAPQQIDSQQTVPQQAAPQQQTVSQSIDTSRVEVSTQETKPVQPAVIASNQSLDSLSVDSLYEAQSSTDAPTTTKVDDLYVAEAKAESTAIVEPFATIAGAPVDEIVDEPLNLPPPRTFESITNVPDFNQLAWNFKQQIPTISYSRHNYVERGIRSVVINGQVLGVGNVSTSSQLVIEDIFVDGVVVRYRDTSFKLKALNGWINM